MANELRAPLNYLTGTLTTAAAISDTTIQSSVFTTLATDYSSTKYLPLVLHDPTAGVYEVVWVTAHSGSSANVTAVRGREGSSARAWPSGTRVICSPTTRDVLSTSTRAGLPADAHYGARYLLTDESVVVEKTIKGYMPSAGVANPSEVGPQAFSLGTFPPTNSVVMVRAGTVTGTLDGTGQTTVNYRVAFPTATIAAIPVSRFTGSKGPIVVFAASASGFSVIFYENPATGARSAGQDFTLSYMAVGY